MLHLGSVWRRRGFFDAKGVALSMMAFAVGVLILQYASERWQKQMIEMAEETARQMEWEYEQDQAYRAQFGEQFQLPADAAENFSQPIQLGGDSDSGE